MIFPRPKVPSLGCSWWHASLLGFMCSEMFDASLDDILQNALLLLLPDWTANTMTLWHSMTLFPLTFFFWFEVWRSLDNSPRTHGQVQVLKWFGVANPDALPFQVGSQFVHSHLPLLFCDYYESARPDFGLGPWWIFQFTLSYTNPCRGFGKDKTMQDFMNYLHIYSPSNSGTGWIFAWIRWGSGGHQYPHAPWPAKRVASCHESLDLLQNLRRM